MKKYFPYQIQQLSFLFFRIFVFIGLIYFTMGIMVSISGYSKTAIDEASGDKTPLLLMDHNHLYYILGGVMGIADVINRIRRHASQTGEAYLSVDKFSG